VWQGAIGGYTPQVTGAGYGPTVLTGISLKHTPDDVYAGAQALIVVIWVGRGNRPVARAHLM